MDLMNGSHLGNQPAFPNQPFGSKITLEDPSTYGDDDESDDDGSFTQSMHQKSGKKTKGRVKIRMEFIENKLRRYTTFSKRKTGIMKKAYELSTLTGTQVMLLVASETGHVYTFATRKLQPMITSESGKALIQTCLNSPDPPPMAPGQQQAVEQRMNPTGFEETELTYAVSEEETKLAALESSAGLKPMFAVSGPTAESGAPQTAHTTVQGQTIQGQAIQGQTIQLNSSSQALTQLVQQGQTTIAQSTSPKVAASKSPTGGIAMQLPTIPQGGFIIQPGETIQGETWEWMPVIATEKQTTLKSVCQDKVASIAQSLSSTVTDSSPISSKVQEETIPGNTPQQQGETIPGNTPQQGEAPPALSPTCKVEGSTAPPQSPQPILTAFTSPSTPGHPLQGWPVKLKAELQNTSTQEEWSPLIQLCREEPILLAHSPYNTTTGMTPIPSPAYYSMRLPTMSPGLIIQPGETTQEVPTYQGAAILNTCEQEEQTLLTQSCMRSPQHHFQVQEELSSTDSDTSQTPTQPLSFVMQPGPSITIPVQAGGQAATSTQQQTVYRIPTPQQMVPSSVQGTQAVLQTTADLGQQSSSATATSNTVNVLTATTPQAATALTPSVFMYQTPQGIVYAPATASIQDKHIFNFQQPATALSMSQAAETPGAQQIITIPVPVSLAGSSQFYQFAADTPVADLSQPSAAKKARK